MPESEVPPVDITKLATLVAEQLSPVMQAAAKDAAKDAIRDGTIGDAADARAKSREWKARAEAAEARLPKEGDVVLSGDEAAAWAALLKAGVKPAEVPAKLAAADEAHAKLSAHERAQVVAEAAELAGFHAAALADLVKKDGLTVTLADTTVEQDGKQETVKVPHVTGADGKAVPLTDYADTHWALYGPVLKPESNGRANASGASAKPSSEGTPAPTMRSGAKPHQTQPDVERIAAEQRSRGTYARF